MSSEELIRLKLNNEKLIKTNKKLNEMLKLMEKFRVLLIAMVNNCKCNTESNIRIKFNLLMEDFYDFKDNNNNNNKCFANSRKDVLKINNTTNDRLNVTQTDVNCNQIHINCVVNNLLTEQSLIQSEDNNNFVDLKNVKHLDTKLLITDELVAVIEDPIGDQRRQQKQKLFESMTKTEDGKDLDLRERVARLKRYVARPKIYSRINKTRVRTDQSFECSWPGCEAVFKAKVDLKTHLAFRHLGEKPYRCDWPGCDKQFPVKRNLARHRETHEGVKHYACDWPGCEYKSWYPQGVRAHRKRHTDERPHRCQWPSCEWTFRQSHHLKAHMLKHTGEKPFSCVQPGCDQRFQSRQAMKFHCDRAHHKT